MGAVGAISFALELAISRDKTSRCSEQSPLLESLAVAASLCPGAVASQETYEEIIKTSKRQIDMLFVRGHFRTRSSDALPRASGHVRECSCSSCASRRGQGVA